MSQLDPNQLLYMDFMKEKANLSMRNRQEMCLLAKTFRFQHPLLAIVLLQFVLSSLTLFFLWRIYKCRKLRRVYAIIETDLKIIAIFGFFLYITCTLNSSALYFFKVSLFLLDFDPCTYIWSGANCYFSGFYFSSLGISLYTCVHVSLFLERCFVAMGWRPKLCKDGVLGVLLCLMSVLFTCYPQYLVLRAYSMFMNERLYCGSLLTTINVDVTTGTYFVCSLDLVVSCLDFLLYLYNRKQMRDKKRMGLRPQDYCLKHSFNLKSMQTSIEVIFPFSFVHSLTFCLQSIAYIVYVRYSETASLATGHLLFETVNFNRIAANFILLGFLYFYNQMRTKKSPTVFAQLPNETDIYFREFDRMIS